MTATMTDAPPPAAPETGTEEEERLRWAHRRDPDYSPTPGRRPGDPVPVPRPPGSSRYVWFVGVVFLLVIIVAMVNAISNGGVRAPKSGGDLAPFAAPLVLSALDGDANLATGRKGESKEAGRRPACDVRGADILNSCELQERGPVVLTFFADRGSQCVRQLDVLERLAEVRRVVDPLLEPRAAQPFRERPAEERHAEPPRQILDQRLGPLLLDRVEDDEAVLGPDEQLEL